MIIHTSYLLWCDLALVETWTGDVSIDKQDTEQTSITDPNDMNGINNIIIVAFIYRTSAREFSFSFLDCHDGSPPGRFAVVDILMHSFS